MRNQNHCNNRWWMTHTHGFIISPKPELAANSWVVRSWSLRMTHSSPPCVQHVTSNIQMFAWVFEQGKRFPLNFCMHTDPAPWFGSRCDTGIPENYVRVDVPHHSLMCCTFFYLCVSETFDFQTCALIYLFRIDKRTSELLINSTHAPVPQSRKTNAPI